MIVLIGEMDKIKMEYNYTVNTMSLGCDDFTWNILELEAAVSMPGQSVWILQCQGISP